MNKFKSWVMLRYQKYKAKDILAAGLITMLIMVGLSMCDTAQAEITVESGLGFEFDHPKTFGENPVGIVRIRKRFLENFLIGYEHHSSFHDEDDWNVYDAVEIMFEAPFFSRNVCR